MNKLRFGTGGIPLTTQNRNTTNGLLRLRELGLDHLELEFVHSVYLKPAEFESVKETCAAQDITMTIHGSYFINLAATEVQKWHASIGRIVEGANVGDQVGVKSMTFHAAFFQKQDPALVAQKVHDSLIEVFKKADTKTIRIAPELTGKAAQYGSIEELVALVKSFKGTELEDRVRFCVDFAHNHARGNGVFADKDDFRKFFDYIGAELGEGVLKDLHMHMSAIEFSPKGERNHLTFLDSYDAYKAEVADFPELKEYYAELQAKNRLGGGKQDWKGLLEVLKEYGVGGYLVCESPNLEHDAMLMQKYYQSL
jgi:deoxyribonuclease-4